MQRNLQTPNEKKSSSEKQCPTSVVEPLRHDHRGGLWHQRFQAVTTIKPKDESEKNVNDV